MSAITKQEQTQESVNNLLDLFDGNDRPRIFTVLRHVSTSGMSRDISLFYIKNDHLFNITYHASHALGWKLVERNGSRAIKVGGAGMDMGFHTVYTLSRVLYRGTVDGDAGYKLRHEWM